MAICLAIVPHSTMPVFGAVAESNLVFYGKDLADLALIDTAREETRDSLHFKLAANGMLIGFRLRQKEQFFLCPEPRAFCRLVVGDAMPDDALADFCLPTNPIFACIAEWRQGLFGAGYFDDSGDVPGKPVLFYNVCGTVLDKEEGNFELLKRYESVSNFNVLYKGNLHTGAGMWSNPNAASYGSWSASCIALQGRSANVIQICSVCNRLIGPGEKRWHEDECAVCKKESNLNKVQLFAVSRNVEGQSLAEIVWRSFRKFAMDPFLGRLDATGRLVSSTYAETFLDVERAMKSIPVEANSVLILGNSGYAACVWMLACVLRGGLEILSLQRQVDGIGADWIVDVEETSFSYSSNDEKTILTDLKSVVLMPTSGTTGKAPKMARFSEDLLMPDRNMVITTPFVRADISQFDPSIFPSLIQTMAFGGSRFFLTLNGTLSLLDQMQLVKPTHFGAPPSVWNLLAKVGATKETVGGRLTVCTSGGAQIPAQVKKKLEKRLRVKVVNLYGCRETGGIARDGVCYPGIELRVRNHDGEILPDGGEGELLVFSPKMIDSYAVGGDSSAFCLFDGKRFYCTGDYVVLARGGREIVEFLGRKNDLLKCPDGVWLVPSTIEATIEANAACVHQCFVLSDSKCVLVALGAESDDTIRTEATLASRLVQHAPRLFHVTRKALTVENGLLTTTLKKRRGALRMKFSTVEFKSAPMAACGNDDPFVLDAIAFAVGDRANGKQKLHELTSVELAAAQSYLVKVTGVKLSFTDLMADSQVLSLLLRRQQHEQELIAFDWKNEISSLVRTILALQQNATFVSRKAARESCLLVGSGGFFGNHLEQSLRPLFPDRFICVSRSLGNFELGEPFKLDGDANDLTDVVFNASKVSLTLPYASLRRTNVVGMIEVLKFCLSLKRVPRFHFVSSISACHLKSEAKFEEMPVEILNQKDGYGQTKSVAEHVLYRLGMPNVSIWRMGTIGPSLVDGSLKRDDFFVFLFDAIRRLGNSVPDKASLELKWIPVDRLALAIAKTMDNSSYDDNDDLKILHFHGTSPSLDRIFSLIKDKETIPLEMWRKRVQDELYSDPNDPIGKTLLNFNFTGTGSRVETHLTDALHRVDFLYTDEMLSRFLKAESLL